MQEKFLPIGTVVMLKGASKRLMITGFCSMANEEESVMYDYSGCMYPEGIISSDETALFNHDQIEKIYFVGLSDEEDQEFKVKLKQLLEAENIVSTTSTVEVLKEEKQEEKELDYKTVPPIGPGLDGYVEPVKEIKTEVPKENKPVIVIE